MTTSFHDGVNVSRRISEGSGADVVGVAFLRPKGSKFGEQSAIIRGVVPLLAGVARGIDAGPATERWHDKAAVFAEHPLANGEGSLRCFLAGVRLEAVAIFDHLGSVRVERQILQRNSE